MAPIAAKKLNLPLPREMHEALFSESREMGVPATRLVRSIIEDWLRERGRARRRAEVRRFAMEHAATELDLDSALEAVATAELRRFYGDGERIGALPQEALERIEEGIAAACDLGG